MSADIAGRALDPCSPGDVARCATGVAAPALPWRWRADAPRVLSPVRCTCNRVGCFNTCVATLHASLHHMGRAACTAAYDSSDSRPRGLHGMPVVRPPQPRVSASAPLWQRLTAQPAAVLTAAAAAVRPFESAQRCAARSCRDILEAGAVKVLAPADTPGRCGVSAANTWQWASLLDTNCWRHRGVRRAASLPDTRGSDPAGWSCLSCMLAAALVKQGCRRWRWRPPGPLIIAAAMPRLACTAPVVRSQRRSPCRPETPEAQAAPGARAFRARHREPKSQSRCCCLSVLGCGVGPSVTGRSAWPTVLPLSTPSSYESRYESSYSS